MLNLKTGTLEEPVTTLDKEVDPFIKQVSYLLMPDFLTSDECDKFVDYVDKNHPISRGKSRDQKYTESRTSEITFIEPVPENMWLNQKIYQQIIPVVNKYHKYDLTHLDRLQYASYKKDQYLKLHTDDYFDYLTTKEFSYPLIMRKLSVSIGLNDNYEGGEFEIHNFKGTLEDPYDIKKFKLPKGAAIVFPAFQLHQIYPVTEGERKSVVAWFFGPKWK